MQPQIIIRGARLHNLKNINLEIPKNQIVVLTGLSGSGKSTLGFDILYKEGIRQYLESLGMAAGLNKPPVDSISGLSPSISVDQHLTNHSPRSTVGTATDVYTYLRILFARLGHQPCPACSKDVAPDFDTLAEPWEGAVEDEAGTAGPEETFPCPHCGSPIPQMGMENFSFNKLDGACPTCTGLGVVHQANLARLVNQDLSIAGGAIAGWDIHYIRHFGGTFQRAAEYYGCPIHLDQPVKEFTPAQRDLLFFGVASPQFGQHFPGIQPPDTVGKGRFEGVATSLLRRYAEHIQEAGYSERIAEYLVTQVCPGCQGARLRPESRAVTLDGRGIVGLSHLPLTELADWLEGLPARLNPDEQLVAGPILDALQDRIRRLVEVGVGYLTMERASPSLSAGEAQRLRMAALLGSGLTGVLYVLDEPTIGLHQRDTLRLIGFLRRLRDLGNTVLVIEHDLELIRAADHVVDIGPGAGKWGGQVVAAGTPAEVAGMPGSITGAYLSGRQRVAAPAQRRKPGHKALTIYGARQHNLQNITVRIPLGVLVAVTGVSGSGKSSLVFDILDQAARQHFYGAGEAPGEHDRIEGWEHLDKVITIDQEHIGRIPRSNAATYSDTFTPIREAFAATPEARRMKLTARHFSFNLPGGRCERCEGAGVLTVKMHFLPDAEVRCPACHGKRFTHQVLSVCYRGQNIAQVLDMTVEEALGLFQEVPPAAARLKVLAEVGLGYLQLGQPATTLSGGEAQRVKLAKELGRRSTGRSLVLLDEPTTGQHPDDAGRLLAVLQRLVEAGNSVLVVEHNLDIIQAADWVIDLGPEGGAGGGYVVAEGSPQQVAQVEASCTGRFLRHILAV